MKTTKQQIRTITVLGLAVLLLSSFGAYQLGMRQGKNRASVAKEQAYAQGLSNTRKELNRVTNDYVSACYNYQTLYTAYDELYGKAGNSSGLTKIPRPDGARGNEESCYR